MGRKVFASCTRSTGVLHSLQPLSSLLVSVAVCLVGLVDCRDLVHGSHHHHNRGAGVEPSDDRLCSFTPKEEQEYVAARYESVRQDSGDDLQDFLREWRRDVREEETVRFQPIKMVCSSALQIFPAVPAMIRRHIQCIVCFFMHCVCLIESSMYYYCHCRQLICLGWVWHFQIGSGSQGSVVEAKDLATRKMVAIKQVRHSDLRSSNIISHKTPLHIGSRIKHKQKPKPVECFILSEITRSRCAAMQCNAQVKQAFASGRHFLNGHRVLQELVLLRLMNSSGDTRSRQIPVIQKDLPRLYC